MSHSVEPWSSMDKPTRIAAIINAHNVTDGTASSISAHLSKMGEPVSRNAVIGFYNRNPDTLRAEFPLTGQQFTQPIYRPKKQLVPPKPKEPRPPKPMPAPNKVDIDAPVPKFKLLWQIEVGECKWPVEGDRSETKFCCAPAEKDAVYCTYHRKRGTQTMRSKAVAPKSKAKVPARHFR